MNEGIVLPLLTNPKHLPHENVADPPSEVGSKGLHVVVDDAISSSLGQATVD